MLGIESLSKATLLLRQKLIHERCYLIAKWFFKHFGDDRQHSHQRLFSLENETLWIKCVSNSRYTWMITKFYYCFQSRMRDALCSKINIFEFRIGQCFTLQKSGKSNLHRIPCTFVHANDN